MVDFGNHGNGYKGVEVAVLGASGFIGRWVSLRLCGQGARLSLVIRNAARAKRMFSQYGIKGKIYEVDLQNLTKVRKVIKRIRPSITFNLAGYGVDRSESDEKTSYQINAELVKEIGDSVAVWRDRRWSGQDIVHVGSALEYGSISGNLWEGSTCDPTTDYGRSKLAGTKILAGCCEAYGIKGLTARLFTVYGPGEHPDRLLPSLMETARTGKPLDLTAGGQKRDFTYVEDAAEGLVRLGLASAKRGEIVNLATGRLTSVRSFAETAAGILKIPDDKLKFGAIPTRVEEMDHAEVALDRLRQLISWVPSTGIKAGIAKTIDCGSYHRAGRGEYR